MSNENNIDQQSNEAVSKDEEIALELFAEELADQTDLATPNFCTAATIGTAGTFSCAGSCGGSASSGSSISSAC